MSKAKFEAVKELIAEKRYDQARAILKGIDHPQARNWEIKINELDSGSSKPQNGSGRLVPIVLSGIIVGLVGLLVFMVLKGSQDAQANTANLRQILDEQGTHVYQTVEAQIMVAIDSTLTADSVKLIQPTQDCGAWDWWNENGSSVEDYMSLVESMKDELSGTDEINTISFSISMDSMDESQARFDSVTPPLCANEVQRFISIAMTDYSLGFYEVKFEREGNDLSNATPEEYFKEAQDFMNRAADIIFELTGMDADFMRS